MEFFRRNQLGECDARLRAYDRSVASFVGPDFRFPVRMRDWELHRVLRALPEDRPPGRILEVGSYNTYLAAYLAGLGGEVIASDLLGKHRLRAWMRGLGLLPHRPTLAPFAAWKRVMHAAGAQVRSLDATRLPFADREFDAVIAVSVIEHIPEPAAALAELYRVVAPGGKLLLTTDCAPDAKPFAEGVRYFSPDELREHLAPYPISSIRNEPDFSQDNWCYGGSSPVVVVFVEITKPRG